MMDDFGLYPRERSRMPIEDVIEDMKKKIEILPVTGTATGPDRITFFQGMLTNDVAALAGINASASTTA